MLALVAPAIPVVAAPPQVAAPALHPAHTFPHGYFEYTAAPGSVINDQLTLDNVGTAAGTFQIYASDGVTSPATGVVYASQQRPFPDGPTGNGEYGAGSWIHVSTGSTTLGVGKTTFIVFSVDVPAGTHPGDWVGAVSAETAGPRNSPSGTIGLNVSTRATIAVVVHIPGPVDTSSVVIGTPYVSVNAHGQLLNIPLEYDGDVLLKPVMHFTITDQHRTVLARFDGQYDTFMPHTRLVYAYPLGTPGLAPGAYTFAGDFGAGSDPKGFSRGFSVATGQDATPPPARGVNGPAPAAAAPSWLMPAVILAPTLLVVLLLLLLLLTRSRCTHCNRRRLRLIRVVDHGEIAGCDSCRSLAKQRKDVRLCTDCYRDHVKIGVAVGARLPG